MAGSPASRPNYRRWEPWVFVIGALILGLLILAFYLSSPTAFPENFLPGFS